MDFCNVTTVSPTEILHLLSSHSFNVLIFYVLWQPFFKNTNYNFLLNVSYQSKRISAIRVCDFHSLLQVYTNYHVLNHIDFIRNIRGMLLDDTAIVFDNY